MHPLIPPLSLVFHLHPSSRPPPPPYLHQSFSPLRSPYIPLSPSPLSLCLSIYYRTHRYSCTELVWVKRCSNIVAMLDEIYFVWQSRELIVYKANYTKICKIFNKYVFFLILKMSNIKRCYNVAATLFMNIQRCSNVIWQHFPHFRPTLPLNIVATYA